MAQPGVIHLIQEPWRHKAKEAHPRSMRTQQTHPGEVETYPGAMEAYPGAIVVHYVAKKLILEPWRLICGNVDGSSGAIDALMTLSGFILALVVPI